MSIGNITAIGFGVRKSWRRYWTTLISATVENAAPTHVVLTFPTAKTSLGSADFTCTVNGVARTVVSASWAGAVLTLVLASAVVYGDVVVVTFVKSGGTTNVTNNVLYSMTLTSTGMGTGVSTLAMTVSSNITVTLIGTARFYTDAGGTLNESATWNLTSGGERIIYLSAPSGSSVMKFSDITKLTNWGNAVDGWTSAGSAANIILDISKIINLVRLRMTGNSVITGTLPSGVFSLILGTRVTFSYSSPISNVINYIQLNSATINWTSLDVGNYSAGVTFISFGNWRTNKLTSAEMVTLLTNLTNSTRTYGATITINDYEDYAAPPAGVVTAVNLLKATKSITTVNLGA